jgi:predicted flap endonuclease-1-like 5' DNA nuclease
MEREAGPEDSEFGAVFRKGRPGLIDELQLIRGVRAAEVEALQGLGVFRFWQIAGWTPSQAAAVAARCGFGTRIEREKWVWQAGKLAILSEASQHPFYRARSDVDAAAILATEFAGEEAIVDLDLGIVYPEAPRVWDQLTLIQGVDAASEEAMQRLGIYRFKQIGAWTDRNVGAVAERLGLAKSRIEEQKWVSQAVNLQRVIYAASPVWAEDEPSLEDYGRRAAEVFFGEPVQLSEAAGILYATRPPNADDLTRIHGIDAALESRLNAGGVWRLRQIANWSARNVVAVSEWLGGPADRIYRERWIAQAAELDKEPTPEPPPQPEPDKPLGDPPERDPFEILKDHFAGETGVRIDRRAGVVYGERPQVVDDLTLISGITPDERRRLEEIGIYRFKQIANWSPRNGREVAAVLGIDPSRVTVERWVQEADRLQREFDTASPVWTTPRPSPADYERRMDEAYADDEVGADEELGILYAGAPDLCDDLKRVTGITAELEARLNASGVYRYKQIADWSETNVQAFEVWLGIPRGSIYQQRWLSQAAQLTHLQPIRRSDEERSPLVAPLVDSQFEALAREFGDEAGARIDRQYGIVYDDAPTIRDDLKRLPGVSEGTEDVLHRHGVYRFKQVAAWTPANRAQFARVLGIGEAELEAAKWPERARQLHDETYQLRGPWSVRRPALEAYRQRIAEEFSGEPVRIDEDLGILYTRRPLLGDDLTQIQGMEPLLAARLNASGVWRFKQIANWAEANLEAFARWIGVPAERIAREDWVGQATELARKAASVIPAVAAETDPLVRYTREEGVIWREDLGYIYREAPVVRDDLSRIRGIGGELVAALGKHGIFRFWQIALWPADVVDVISGDLDLGNRIKRERWRPQARILAILGCAGEDGRFVAEPEVDHFVVIEKEFDGETGVRADPRFGIVYDQRPPVVDDLCKIGGITFALEEALQQRGVFRFKQIGHWSNANVSAFAEACGIDREVIETGKWIPQARWQHLRVYGQATRWAEPKPSVDRFEELLTELFPGQSVRVDGKFGFVSGSRPRRQDDLSRVRGISESLARSLGVCGIHRFRQVAWWSEANVRALGKKLGFLPDQVYREAWMAQAAKLDEEQREEEPVAVESDPDPETPGFEHGVVTDPDLGSVFTARPALTDDLKAICGIGPKLERMLNGLGIYRFSQIANWDEARVTAISARMHFRERIQRERWVEQARELAAWRRAEHQESFFAPAQLDQMAIVQRELSDEPGVRVDPYSGIVFDQAPAVADDLTAIDGIGKRMEGELHECGVYRYLQIANWTDTNVTQIAENLSCLKDRIERDKWIPQARRLHRETYSANRAWGVEAPSLADYQARIEEEFAGEAVRPEPELGIIYSGWPSHVDDLKVLTGIDAQVEQVLNRLGVYCVKQIANWSVANVEAFAKQLGTSAQRIYRDRWIPLASNLSCKHPLPVQPVFDGLDVDLRRVLSAQPDLEADERLGFVYRQRPAEVDPLHLIRGLGHRWEAQVQKLGVYRFRQIASWSDPQVEEFGARLKLGPRVRQSNWVGQAREWAALAEEERARSFVAPSLVDHEAALKSDFANDPGARGDGALGILYDAEPRVRDDLSAINGIGAQMERELNELGVYRFKQIARWSDANVAEFARRLFCQKERIERDKWVPQAKRLLKLVYAASLEWGLDRPGTVELEAMIRAEFPGQSVRADEDCGILYTEAPARADDLKEIPGINGLIERAMQAAGVWRFLQIARWAPWHVETFAARLQLPAEQIYRDGWIRRAQQLAASQSVVPDAGPAAVGKPDSPGPRRSAGETAPSVPEPSPVVEPEEEKGAEAKVQPSAPEPENLIPAPNPELRPSAVPEEPALVFDEAMGPVYRDRPAKIDDLRQIGGVSLVLERRLHLSGVYRYRQIAAWTPGQVANHAERLDLGDRIEREKWVSQAAELAELVEADEADDLFVAPPGVDYHQIMRQHFDGESGLRIDPRFGIVFDQRPEWVDDLKRIEGVGPRLERQLNQFGIYQFRQIAHWSASTVGVFEQSLGIAGDQIARDRWLPQARRLERETVPVETEWGEQQPGPAELQGRVGEEFPGEDVEVDADYGIVYVSRPQEVDNLKRVKGIGGAFEEALQSVGVYRFKQIASWGDGNVEAFARLLRTRRQRIYRERWIRQAREMANESRRTEPVSPPKPRQNDDLGGASIASEWVGEDVIESLELGLVFRTPPREVDDLKKIRGIGRKLEDSLNDHGVYRFGQIALWTDRNVEEFSRRLPCFGDRILRDGWIEQAGKLCAEKRAGRRTWK